MQHLSSSTPKPILKKLLARFLNVSVLSFCFAIIACGLFLIKYASYSWALFYSIGLAGLSTLFYMAICERVRAEEKCGEMQATLEEETQHKVQLTIELEKVKEDLQHNILHDGVTGLPGRQLFDDRFKHTVAQSQRHQLIFATIVININEFKVVTDSLGVDVGDELLKEASTRIQTCLRSADTLTRLSNDKFCIILQQLVRSEVAAHIAKRLVDVFAPAFSAQGHEVFLTVNLGVAIFPHDGEDQKTLIKNADIARYQGKQEGFSNYQFYHCKMQPESHRQLTLNASLPHALERKELVLLYQPVVDVVQKKIINMEALLRWQHPELGLVTPNEFLFIAERTGMIIPIGEWTLRTACQQFKDWQRKEISSAGVSINISLRQLDNPHFIYQVDKVLQETGVNPHSLSLEISEGPLMRKPEIALKTVAMLKDMGIRIALDDFGAGFSSLSYLQRFNVDEVKIAHGFIQDITADVNAERMIQAVIALAKTLQLNIVAKGVETQLQKKLLQQLGCNVMQGYLFSPPISVEELLANHVEVSV